MKSKTLFKKKTNHLLVMTSQIGFYQFAKITTPDLKYGYSLDDQARALILALLLYRRKKEKKFLNLAKIYLNFIKRAQRRDGYFHNFADANGRFIDRIGSQDCFGRTIWALGFCQARGSESLQKEAEKIFKKSKARIQKLRYIRSKAYASLGLVELYQKEKTNEIEDGLKTMAQYLVKKFKENSSSRWKFFENKLIYANAILPYSLLSLFKVLGGDEKLKIGLEALDFLNRVSRMKGYPAPIGYEGWYFKGKKKSLFGQQPIDVADMVLASAKAYELTGKQRYFKMMREWFTWFLGNNIYQLKIYDQKTGGCRDGIFKKGINPNQGAESTIVFHLANLEIERLSKKNEES